MNRSALDALEALPPHRRAFVRALVDASRELAASPLETSAGAADCVIGACLGHAAEIAARAGVDADAFTFAARRTFADVRRKLDAGELDERPRAERNA